MSNLALVHVTLSRRLVDEALECLSEKAVDLNRVTDLMGQAAVQLQGASEQLQTKKAQAT